MAPGFVAGLMLTGLLMAGAVVAQDSELVAVPHPNLATLDPVVREILTPAVDYFEAKKNGLRGVELGQLYGRLGLHYHSHNMTDAAKACYTNATTLNPINFRWSYLLAMQYEVEGDVEAAIKNYEMSLRINPGNLAGFSRVGILYIQAGHLDDAAQMFKRVLDQIPGDEASLAGMGHVEQSRGNYSIALLYFQRALAGQPQAGAIRFKTSAIYKSLGDEEKAAQELTKANQQVPRVFDPLFSFMRAHQLPSSKFVADGTELAENDNLDGAIKLFGLATAINPGDAIAFQKLAQSQRRQGKNKEANRNLDEVLRLEPFNAFANYLKANWLEQEGDDQLAIGYYRSAVNAEESFIGARMLLANALMRTGGYDEAAKYYQMVIDAQPENREPYYRLGIANIARDQCADAIVPLEKAAELNDQDPKAFLALARVWSTCSAANQDQKAKALEYATRIYEQFGNMQATATLAMAEAAHGRYEEAEAYQAQAMFEAIKTGDEHAKQEMYVDMQQYRTQKPAERSWQPGAAVFFPPRMLPPTTKTATATQIGDAG